MNTLALHPVWRSEVRTFLGHHLFDGLMISLAIHALVLGNYFLFLRWGTSEDDAPMVRLRIVKYSDLGPPPSIVNTSQMPVIGVTAAAAKPTIGIPVPVPDVEVNPEQTIATQQELSAVSSPILGEGNGTGGGLAISKDINIDDAIEEPDINTFVAVEKPPQIIRSVNPVYPEMARKAGIEGVVWVKVLVGKDGKPKRAVIIKDETDGLFNQAATDAAMQYSFTPGIMNAGPVQVWIALKFRFQLAEHHS